MIKVGITGASGMIGLHLRSFLEMKSVPKVKIANRDTFKSKKEMIEFVYDLDVIIHLACQCRGDALIETNNKIDKFLTSAIDEALCKPHIIFTSSTHIEINKSSEYSKSKLASSKYFNDWAASNGIKFSNMIVPHVFGESGKPFHNSVISTFSQQLANSKKIKLHEDKILELIHAQKLSKFIYEAANNGISGEIIIPGVQVKVSEVMSKLILFDKNYREHIIPEFSNSFDLDLFNTYRSFFPSTHFPVLYDQFADDRGYLFEATKSLNSSQCFVSTTKPGITRGNHYHHEKIERFVVLKGKGKISLRRKYQDEIVEYIVDGAFPSYVDIPTLHTHNIENVGDSEMLVLFWSHQLYDSSNPDTYVEEV